MGGSQPFTLLGVADGVATPGGHISPILLDRDAEVTLMRHLFGHPGSVLLLTHLMILAPALLLLVPLASLPLFLSTRQQRTRPAVPVAAIATAADHDWTATSLAVEESTIKRTHL